MFVALVALLSPPTLAENDYWLNGLLNWVAGKQKEKMGYKGYMGYNAIYCAFAA